MDERLVVYPPFVTVEEESAVQLKRLVHHLFTRTLPRYLPRPLFTLCS